MALTTVRPQGMGFVTGRKNLIINGAMQVAQRGTQVTGLGASGMFLLLVTELSILVDQHWLDGLQQSTVKR